MAAPAPAPASTRVARQPADERPLTAAVCVFPALPAPPRLRAVLAGPGLLVAVGGAAGP